MEETTLTKTAPKKKLYEFAVIPIEWLERGELAGFHSGKDLKALSALRVLLALAFIARESRISPGLVVEERHEQFLATYSSIQRLAGFDRTKINESLQILEAKGVIEVTRRRGRASLYRFKFSEKRWAKVPLRASGNVVLKALSLRFSDYRVSERHRHLLAALKIYLYLIGVRQAKGSRATVAYSVFERKCGVQRKDIAGALSILNSLKLVVTENSFVPDTKGAYRPATNSYVILGLSDYRPQNGLIPNEALFDHHGPFDDLDPDEAA